MSESSKYSDVVIDGGVRAVARRPAGLRTVALRPLAPGTFLALYGLGCLLCLLVLVASTLLPGGARQPLQLIGGTGIALNLMVGLGWVRQLLT